MPGPFLLALLLASAPPEGARRLPPVDECAADASFAAFREELLAAVDRRDAAHVQAVVADDIAVDFGGGAGREYFAEAWNLDLPESSALWSELRSALELGCAVAEDGSYWAPSLFLAEGIEDPFASHLVVAPGTALYAEDSNAGEVIARLEWDLVEALDGDEGQAWRHVRLADGREGYVIAHELRSPVDYRAGFERVDGRWRMGAFIAGD